MATCITIIYVTKLLSKSLSLKPGLFILVSSKAPNKYFQMNECTSENTGALEEKLWSTL